MKKNSSPNNSATITHRQKKTRIRDFNWVVSASIILTVVLLIVSCLLALKLWEKEKDAGIYTLIATFCIFNVAETFLSVYLLISTVTMEFNNRVAMLLLVNKLKELSVLPPEFVLPTAIYEEIKTP